MNRTDSTHPSAVNGSKRARHLKVAGLFLRDVVLTSDEIKGLTREYLYADRPVRRGVDFSTWLADESVASRLGLEYASELARHFRI